MHGDPLPRHRPGDGGAGRASSLSPGGPRRRARGTRPGARSRVRARATAARSRAPAPRPRRPRTRPRRAGRRRSCSASRRFSPERLERADQEVLVGERRANFHRRVPRRQHREVVLVEVGHRLGVVRCQLGLGDLVDPGAHELAEQLTAGLAADRLRDHADGVLRLNEAQWHGGAHGTGCTGQTAQWGGGRSLRVLVLERPRRRTGPPAARALDPPHDAPRRATPRPTSGALWCTVFDPSGGGPAAVKQSLPEPLPARRRTRLQGRGARARADGGVGADADRRRRADAPPQAERALPAAAAQDQARGAGARRERQRARGARRRARRRRRLARDRRPQLGRRARRALGLAARRGLRGRAGHVAGARDRPRARRRRAHAVDRQRRRRPRRPALPARRARARRGRARDRRARAGWRRSCPATA